MKEKKGKVSKGQKMIESLNNILQVIELADVCSIQTWMLPAIDEYVPSDVC